MTISQLQTALGVLNSRIKAAHASQNFAEASLLVRQRVKLKEQLTLLESEKQRAKIDALEQKIKTAKVLGHNLKVQELTELLS